MSSMAPYVTLFRLAKGGLGYVDLVLRHEGSFERLYAMKRLHDIFLDDEHVRSMFIEEARIAGLLRHQNVVSVHDVGEDPQGPFLVMDYVEGLSLANFMKDLSEGELLPLNICLQIAQQAARGLHTAHELRSNVGEPLGLVHRDVSPQNILLSFDGVIKIIDFGIAKLFGSSNNTMTGVLKGKTGYMSPEQLRFLSLDRRSDLFSLGIVLFEILTGNRLYGAASGREVPQRILNEPAPDISELRRDVPPSLVALLFELLVKDPNCRPDDSITVVHRLDEVMSDALELEEYMPLESFIEQRFGKMRKELRVRIREAVQGQLFDGTHDFSIVSSVDIVIEEKLLLTMSLPTSTEVTTQIDAKPIAHNVSRKGRAWRLGVLAVSCIALLVVGAGFFSWSATGGGAQHQSVEIPKELIGQSLNAETPSAYELPDAAAQTDGLSIDGPERLDANPDGESDDVLQFDASGAKQRPLGRKQRRHRKRQAKKGVKGKVPAGWWRWE